MSRSEWSELLRGNLGSSGDISAGGPLTLKSQTRQIAHRKHKSEHEEYFCGEDIALLQ